MWKQFHTRASSDRDDTAVFAKVNLGPVGRCGRLVSSARVLRKIARGLADLTNALRARESCRNSARSRLHASQKVDTTAAHNRALGSRA
jgi:hypothetical protein